MNDTPSQPPSKKPDEPVEKGVLPLLPTQILILDRLASTLIQAAIRQHRDPMAIVMDVKSAAHDKIDARRAILQSKGKTKQLPNLSKADDIASQLLKLWHHDREPHQERNHTVDEILAFFEARVEEKIQQLGHAGKDGR